MTLLRVALDDKYAVDSGRVYLTGTQALVRLLLMQERRDRAAGLNTAGFVSGYRGSPLANFDQELWRAESWLRRHDIRFQPGVNEDLAATAIWGTQQVHLLPGARCGGVFAMWYGKGPGVDRSGDVFRHANLAGTSPQGGVLVVAGDDPGASSSTVPSQSEFAFIDAQIPMLYPANVQELLDFGLFGWAMSRFSGCWVAMKTVSETVNSSASVDVDPERIVPVCPQHLKTPPGGVHIRLHDWPPHQPEFRLHRHKLPAALAFARANRLNQAVIDGPQRRFGIVTTGKSFLDAMQALDDLGIDETLAGEIGISLFKVGMPWPLEPDAVRRFGEGLEEILVVEEKRAIIESQLKEQLCAWRADLRPRVVGKVDESGEWMLPPVGELTPARIAQVIARRIERFYRSAHIRNRLAFLDAKERALGGTAASVRRLPYFCSGCPHNTSTRVPEGSIVVAGIGCHFMASWMNRGAETATHMGGEGVNWCGMAPFTDLPHMFVNLGDGTYFHSGLLAIRAAVAAGVNVTYKTLCNNAVAMTGGQPIDGPLDAARITRQVAAEGVKRIAVVSDDPGQYIAERADFAPGTTLHHRDDLEAVQRDFRGVSGATVIVYDQTCAAEQRRRRKRGLSPDPPTRVFINELVCEGCGDCGAKSNCVSIVPTETEWGRKRAIDQSSCNKDYSCLKGFCPSFVTIEGARLRRSTEISADAIPLLPEPTSPAFDEPYGIVVAGIGGTGVVTAGALLGMAAHIESKGVAVLDQIGLAQKNGAVVTHVRIAASPKDIRAVRIATGGARLLLGGDLVASASSDVLDTLRAGSTRVLVNSHRTMTAEFTRDPDLVFPEQELQNALVAACGEGAVESFDVAALATGLLGDAAPTNVLMLGFAYQRGLLPLSAAAIERAIGLNGVAVEDNTRAFRLGRWAAHDWAAVARLVQPESAADEAPARDLDRIVALRVDELTRYQNAAYARRYSAFVENVRRVEAERVPESTALAEAVARSYFKLLAYKDEYEVARLFADGRFERSLRRRFEGDVRLAFHLAPPLWAKKDPVTGELRKRAYGPWTMLLFRELARLKGLRGTVFDVFGHTAERKRERQLIVEYETTVATLLAGLDRNTHRLACEIAALPLAVRGFGSIKMESVERAKRREAELLETLRAPSPTASAAE